ncbi:MAG: glycosyltransferase [Acidimicrobiales bacterium]|nr:glycosyltransferase [Acidimicrobiales bacterium]
MLNRRWTTAWRLFRSGKVKELLSRTFRFLSSLRDKKNKITYPEWRQKWVDLKDEERQKIKRRIDSFYKQLSFTLILETQGYESTDIFETIKSLTVQLYPNWLLRIVNWDSMEKELKEKILGLQDNRIKVTSHTSELGNWIIELTPGTKLHETALFSNAFSAINRPVIEVIYSDHDHINAAGEFCDPYMKPDWNPDLFAAMNYFGPLVACKRELWETHTDDRSDKYEFLLKTTKNVSQDGIFHIPDVLASIPVSHDETHLKPTCKRITHPLPEPEPFVSILIPTRDKGRILEKCLESLFEKTSYSNFEVILINHETSESKALKVIQKFEKKSNFEKINFSGPFNFSAMMNLAGNTARGDVLVLLNNDMKIIDSEWLSELVSQVSRPEVGIAGALLLFKDGTIQHAGVHPGLGGLMGHGHKHLPGDNPGYFNRLKAVHSVAAVTGACMAIEKSTWFELGGLDEENLPVAYNDIDLCFKARKKGLSIIFTPYAKIIHLESASRGVDDNPLINDRLQKELEIMKGRWGEILNIDPAYSPNLSFDGGSFELSANPKL